MLFRHVCIPLCGCMSFIVHVFLSFVIDVAISLVSSLFRYVCVRYSLFSSFVSFVWFVSLVVSFVVYSGSPLVLWHLCM